MTHLSTPIPRPHDPVNPILQKKNYTFLQFYMELYRL